jgi:riboflavin-specific deaminase-like protein
METAQLPFIFANTAITADGKIAPDTRRFVPFSSKADQQLLYALRTRADAVMAGARTVDTGKVDLGPGGPKYQRMRVENGRAQFNLRVIVSPTASVNPKAHIFTTRFSPIILLTSRGAPENRVKRLARVVDDLFLSPGPALDLRAAILWLNERWKVKRLLCEGGGEVNAQMFHDRLIQEVYLTVSPVIFGGRTAPTLADGAGIERLSDAIRLRLKRMERVGGDLFCVYRVLGISGH